MATTGVQSLIDLCLEVACYNLETLKLEAIKPVPTAVASRLLDRVQTRFGVARHYLVRQLYVLARAWWRPCGLEVQRHPSPLYLPGLDSVSSSLRRLDLSSCTWLSTLSALPYLTQLQCLRLNGDCQVPTTELAYVSAMPSLCCLELQGWSSLTDDVVLPYVYSLPGLTSLNLSSCPVGDGLIDGLTYGLRLAEWRRASDAAKAAAAKKRDRDWTSKKRGATGEAVAAQAFKKAKEDAAAAWASACEEVVQGQNQEPRLSQQQQRQEQSGAGEGQWPMFTELQVLRLRDTRCTKQGMANLTAFPKLSCVDLRGTHITRHFLQPLQTKNRLSSSPNEPLVLAPSNKMLIDLQRGKLCGCSLLGSFGPSTRPAPGSSALGPKEALKSPVGDGHAIFRRKELLGSSEEQQQWDDLCAKGVLAYIEAAGAEAAIGRM